MAGNIIIVRVLVHLRLTFMNPRCAPPVMFLLAACALNAQVGIEGVLPSSVSSTQVQSALGNDDSNAGLEKAAVRLQALSRERFSQLRQPLGQ